MPAPTPKSRADRQKLTRLLDLAAARLQLHNEKVKRAAIKFGVAAAGGQDLYGPEFLLTLADWSDAFQELKRVQKRAGHRGISYRDIR